jgi:hypothetical protein
MAEGSRGCRRGNRSRDSRRRLRRRRRADRQPLAAGLEPGAVRDRRPLDRRSSPGRGTRRCTVVSRARMGGALPRRASPVRPLATPRRAGAPAGAVPGWDDLASGGRRHPGGRPWEPGWRCRRRAGGGAAFAFCQSGRILAQSRGGERPSRSGRLLRRRPGHRGSGVRGGAALSSRRRMGIRSRLGARKPGGRPGRHRCAGPSRADVGRRGGCDRAFPRPRVGVRAAAEAAFARAVTLARRVSSRLVIAHGLLAHAVLARRRGAHGEARTLAREARRVLADCRDAGIVGALLVRTERTLQLSV